MYEYIAIITNVVDGDTFDLDIDLGFHVHINERIRLLGVDCPEKNLRNGEEEKRAGLIVADWAKKNLSGEKVAITSYKGTDSFGRWLVDMKIETNQGWLELREVYNMYGFNKLDRDYSLQRILEREN